MAVEPDADAAVLLAQKLESPAAEPDADAAVLPAQKLESPAAESDANATVIPARPKAFEGSDNFWAFVDKVSWPANDSDTIREIMETNWSVDEIVGFEKEYSKLCGRISETTDKALTDGIRFYGGDDLIDMDLPGDVISRGKDFFKSVVDKPRALASLSEGVQEGFCYIFHEFV